MTEPSALIDLVGAMTVRQLADHAGLSIEQLVDVVLGTSTLAPSAPAPPVPAPPAPARRARDRRPRPKPRAKPSGSPVPPWRTMRDATDRWLVGEALRVEKGNITRTAQRLGTTRKGVRERWARVHEIDARQMQQYFKQVGGKPPTLQALRKAATLHSVHDMVDAWLLGLVMTEEHHNISAASRRLVVSRRNLRERWARVRPR